MKPALNKAFLKICIFLCYSFYGILQTYSQDGHSIFLEPDFNVLLQKEQPWSYSFGIAHRSILLQKLEEETIMNFQTEHLELNQGTSYSFTSQFHLAFRIRYRFKNTFNTNEYNELRFIEEFSFNHKNWLFQPSHRVRIEQRLKEFTSHRFRYQLKIAHPLATEFTAIIATEALYSIEKIKKPELEQRFELAIENTSFQNLELNIGLEYRLNTYLREPKKEFFLQTGATLAL